MNCRWSLMTAATLAAATPLAARADDSSPPALDDSNPYSVIAERNVFHLTSPPPPPKEEAPKADLPVIKITGFIKTGDQIRALFIAQPKDGKTPPTYFNLGEGEREGILELVKIRPDKEEVDIINSGTAATLSLKDDGLTPSTPSKDNPQPPANNLPSLPHPPFGNNFRRGPQGEAMPIPFPSRPRRMPGGPPPGQ